MGQGKIDGEYFSWAELEVAFGVIKGPVFSTEDIAALDFSDKVEPGAVRGAGPKKRGTTVGLYDADASFSLYLDAAGVFMNKLKTVNPRITLVHFNISAVWAPLSLGGRTIHAKLIGCRIKERQVQNAPSADATMMVFPLDITDLEIDGVKLV